MNTLIQNKRDMCETVNDVLLLPAYKALWQGIPGFAKLQLDLAGSLETANTATGQLGPRKSGLAEAKQAARLAMCKAANVVAGGVAAYAHKAGNHELLTRTDTNLSILLGGRAKDSSDKCKDILAAAKANFSVLADYNVTQAKVTKLEELIAGFDALVPKPTARRATRKGLNEAADLAVDHAEGVLNNGLDKLMLDFEESNPQFFRDYWNARVIIDRAGGHASPNAKPPTPPAPAPK